MKLDIVILINYRHYLPIELTWIHCNYNVCYNHLLTYLLYLLITYPFGFVVITHSGESCKLTTNTKTNIYLLQAHITHHKPNTSRHTRHIQKHKIHHITTQNKYYCSISRREDKSLFSWNIVYKAHSHYKLQVLLTWKAKVLLIKLITNIPKVQN